MSQKEYEEEEKYGDPIPGFYDGYQMLDRYDYSGEIGVRDRLTVEQALEQRRQLKKFLRQEPSESGLDKVMSTTYGEVEKDFGGWIDKDFEEYHKKKSELMDEGVSLRDAGITAIEYVNILRQMRGKR